MGPF
jgi:hypothetical protein